MLKSAAGVIWYLILFSLVRDDETPGLTALLKARIPEALPGPSQATQP